jgi:hypothetical protein
METGALTFLAEGSHRLLVLVFLPQKAERFRSPKTVILLHEPRSILQQLAPKKIKFFLDVKRLG